MINNLHIILFTSFLLSACADFREQENFPTPYFEQDPEGSLIEKSEIDFEDVRYKYQGLEGIRRVKEEWGD